MTINVQPSETALSKSPILFMVTDNDPTRLTAIADVYMWRGSVTNIPSEKSYRLKKSIVDPTSAVFNIGRLVDDFLTQPNPNTYDLSVFEASTTEVCWVLVRFGWIDNNGVISENQEDSNEFICVGGYGEFLEGVNQPIPSLLTSVKSHNLSSDNKLILGVNNSKSSDTKKIVYTSDTGNNQEFNIVGDNDFSGDCILHFDASPSLFVGTYKNSYKLELLDNLAASVDVVNVNVSNLCKYEPISVGYINRFGVWDFLPFNGKSIEKTEATNSDFQNSDLGLELDTSGGIPFSLKYDSSDSQYKRFNGEFRRQRTLNTNFVSEEFYNGLEQLLISERCYLWEYTSPVNPVGKSITRRTGLNDKLIQYSLTFEEAYSTQNQIR